MFTDTDPPVISDIATPIISSDSAVITWKTDKPAMTTIDWGTASTSLNRSSKLDEVLSIYHIVTLSSSTLAEDYSVQGLSPSTPYFFRVFSADASGNIGTSTTQTFTTPASGNITIVNNVVRADTSGDGKGDTTVDDTPPIIISTEVSNITAFSADVKITTNKDTIALVNYGTTTDLEDIASEKDYSTTKTIRLKRLLLGTPYTYVIKVVDKAGNVTTSDDKTFTTLFAAESLASTSILDKAGDIQGKLEQLIESALPSLSPPFLSEPQITDITENGATITWKTNIKTIGSLNYAKDDDYTKNGGTYALNVPASPDKEAVHTVELTNLLPSTKYHIQASSYVFSQVKGTSKDISFTTKAPSIQGSIVERKTDSFRVAWTSGTPSTSIVEYKNTRTGEMNKKVTKDLVTSHDVTVSALSIGDTYEVSISGVSTNGALLEAQSPFVVTLMVDKTPPQIALIKVNSALVSGRTDRAQTVISWQTDEPSTSVVTYEEGSGSSDKPLANSVLEAAKNYTTNHAVIIPSLKSGTIYRIQIASEDEAGNISKLPVRTIITPKNSESVIDLIFKNFEDTFQVFKQVR
jgi:hypothetical protein